MIEYYIMGTCRAGKIYPREHGMTLCIQREIAAYQKKYPPVIHINVDMALDEYQPVGRQQ